MGWPLLLSNRGSSWDSSRMNGFCFTHPGIWYLSFRFEKARSQHRDACNNNNNINNGYIYGIDPWFCAMKWNGIPMRTHARSHQASVCLIEYTCIIIYNLYDLNESPYGACRAHTYSYFIRLAAKKNKRWPVAVVVNLEICVFFFHYEYRKLSGR